MTAKRWLLILSVIVFLTCAIASAYFYIDKQAVAQARSADDKVNEANSLNQPVSFAPYPGETSKSCDGGVGAPAKLGSGPTPVPAPKASGVPDAIPKSIVVGDVLQVTIAFVCSFSDFAAITQMRDSNVQFKPVVSALDFDVDGVMADELAGRDFYCVESPSDGVCADGSTTPAQDLKWTWFLRPRSVGRHFVRIEIYQRKIVGPGKYMEIAPRWIKEYTVDVQPPFTSQMTAWLAVVGGLAGILPLVVAVRKVVFTVRSSISRGAGERKPVIVTNP